MDCGLPCFDATSQGPLGNFAKSNLVDFEILERSLLKDRYVRIDDQMRGITHAPSIISVVLLVASSS